MADMKVVGIGLGIAVVSVIISMVFVATAPSLDDTDGCDEWKASGDSAAWESHGCEQIEQDDSTAMTFFFIFCCGGMPIGGIIATVGFFRPGLAQPQQVIIQQVPQMVAPQPIVAPQPVQRQQSQREIELEIKQRHMQNVETLRQEGRLMEAALEAETAGEWTFAEQLRRDAVDSLRREDEPTTSEDNRYLAFLTSAMADGFLSVEEEQLLEQQRATLNIGWDTHVQMLAQLGYSPESLKQYQNAKTSEDSGRFAEAAAIYESLGNHDKAQLLRMKAQMMESKEQGSVTYNISDSVVQGDLDRIE
jgi:hypothetical protein